MTARHGILVTGATGYIGGRLLAALEARGDRVRCLARRPENLGGRAASTTEVVRGDVLDPASLVEALRSIEAAYYLVHSLGSARGFEDEERKGAENFAAAARQVGVRRIVYLGGLIPSGDLSPHLSTRADVGRILRESGVPTLEFRASIVVGSGSLSFEMIRALVEKLPVMVAPRWVRTLAQPIAIEDVVAYLIAALDVSLESSKVYEIGGPDRVSYHDLMQAYAAERGLKRWIITVPVLTTRLSSLWLGLVTPLYARIGRKLIDSLRNETVVTDESARRDFAIRPRGVGEAIRRALSNEDQQIARTRWSDALSSGGAPRHWGGIRFGSRIVDSRSVEVTVSADRAFAPIRRIGGRTGWYWGDWLWWMRGMLDLFVGGVGLRRGRRDPENMSVGDTLDFWRVEAIEPDRLLRLHAEMKLPGRAWLQFEVEPVGEARPPRSTIRQTALFDPIGLPGLLYWYALYPLHRLVFAGMLRGIARRASQDAQVGENTMTPG